MAKQLKNSEGYVDPSDVHSPKSWKFKATLYNSEDDAKNGGWSIAIGCWEKRERLAIRWNGNASLSKGSPKSHGYPTWFILPEETEKAMLHCLQKIIADRTLHQARIFLGTRPLIEAE